MKTIAMILGTRPNIMKAVPVYKSLKNYFNIIIIHTGQHNDSKMNQVFFEELGLPKPCIQLNTISGTKAGDLDNKLYINNNNYLSDIDSVILDILNAPNLGQLGDIRNKLILNLKILRPDLVVVFGDVTSTLAAAIASKYLNIKIAHIESGLRSFDLTMPEEVNRILIDHISNYFFITEKSGVENLINEKKTTNLYFVGNPMINCLLQFKNIAMDTKIFEKFKLEQKKYVLITLHRPSNVDIMTKLEEIIHDVCELAKYHKIIFPVHPRTKNNLDKINFSKSNIIFCEPLPYLQFLCLQINSRGIITDSGGIQEESSALGIRCYTLRDNTERPGTLIENGGTNTLIKKITPNLIFSRVNINNSINFHKNVDRRVSKILKYISKDF